MGMGENRTLSIKANVYCLAEKGNDRVSVVGTRKISKTALRFSIGPYDLTRAMLSLASMTVLRRVDSKLVDGSSDGSGS